jgi:hypothetical protein
MEFVVFVPPSVKQEQHITHSFVFSQQTVFLVVIFLNWLVRRIGFKL